MGKSATPEILREFLVYNPETGKLFWRTRAAKWFAGGVYGCERNAKQWNARMARKEAFTAFDAHGYHIGAVFNKGLKAHRVIWAMVYGEWPENDIDHVNGDRSDNRLCNLRAAERAQNLSNMRRPVGKSGYIGVHPDKDRWAATISKNNRKVYLGAFATPEEAARARDAAAIEMRGPFATLNFPVQ